MSVIELPTVFAMTEHAWRHFDSTPASTYVDGRVVIDGTCAGKPVRLVRVPDCQVRVVPLTQGALRPEFVGKAVS